MTTTTESRALELRRRDVRAIAIGGSAGAFEALRTVLSAVPASLDVPVLVVLHIAAEAKTSWPAVFSGCPLPVREAEDKEVATPGAVHVAPPGYHLLVDPAGVLNLSVDAPVHMSRPAIDVLFESAAWAFRGRLLGVVLSGANADGAAGLSAVHAAGGVCWVQSPPSASATAMPRAAAGAVPQASVLSPEEMADVLRAWQG